MKKSFIRNRKMRHGGITVALTVLVIAVTLLVNAVFGSLATRYNWMTDMNELGLFEVTDECYAYLEDVFSDATANGRNAQVEIIFCDELKKLNEEPTQKQLYHTAKSLQERFPDHIVLNCYDILSDPTYVKQYATQENPHTGVFDAINIDTTDVVIRSDGYHRVYNLSEFFAFKENSAENLWGYNGERRLAAGIMRAVAPNLPKACLTTNHGEVFSDYEILRVLEDAGYKVTYLDLYQETEVPADCSLVVTYNPMSDMIVSENSDATKSERAKLDRFLSKDGNAFWFFSNNATPTLENFESFMESWGVDYSYHTSNGHKYRYTVQDTAQSLTTDGCTIYGEAATAGKGAEILSGLRSAAIFRDATAIVPATGFVNNGDGSYTKGDRVLYSLYTGGESAVSWANGVAVSDADQAILMSLTEQTLENNGRSYVGAFSSTGLATEQFLQSAVYANPDVLCAVTEEQGMENTPISLTLKPYAQTEISTVTTRQMTVWTLCLCLVPAVVIAAACGFVMIKRRRA